MSRPHLSADSSLNIGLAYLVSGFAFGALGSFGAVSGSRKWWGLALIIPSVLLALFSLFTLYAFLLYANTSGSGALESCLFLFPILLPIIIAAVVVHRWVKGVPERAGA